MTRAPKRLAGVVMAGLLAACGGGGGGEESTPPPVSSCSAWPEDWTLPADLASSVIEDVVAIDGCTLVLAGHAGAAQPLAPDGDTTGFVLALTIDREGTVRERWRHLVDTPGTDLVSHLIAQAEDLQYLGTTDAPLDGVTGHGKADAIIGWLDRNGTLLGRARVGDERPNQPLALIEHSDGSGLLIGSDDVYVPTNFVDDFENPWLATLSMAGNRTAVVRWQRGTNPVADRHTAAAGLPDGGALVALATAAGDMTGVSLARHDRHGGIVWQTRLSSGPFDNAATIERTDDDTLTVFGSATTGPAGEGLGAGDLFVSDVAQADGRHLVTRWLGSPEIDWAVRMLAHGPRRYAVSESFSNDFGTWRARVYILDPQDGRVVGARILISAPRGAVRSAAIVGTQLAIAGSIDAEDGRLRGWLRFMPLDYD